MIAAASLCLLIVAAVGLRALPRPLAEILVDALHRRAHRARAQAVAADRALVAYRRELDALRAAHRPEYGEVA